MRSAQCGKKLVGLAVFNRERAEGLGPVAEEQERDLEVRPLAEQIFEHGDLRQEVVARAAARGVPGDAERLGAGRARLRAGWAGRLGRSKRRPRRCVPRPRLAAAIAAGRPRFLAGPGFAAPSQRPRGFARLEPEVAEPADLGRHRALETSTQMARLPTFSPSGRGR